jgi:hypothetical protein
VFRRILGPVYDNEKEYWRILIKKCMKLLKTHYNRDSKVTQITLMWAHTEDGTK